MLHHKFLNRHRIWGKSGQPVTTETALELIHHTERLGDALDAVEMLVEQYLYVPDQPGVYDHAHMAAGEYACQVLVDERPDRWERTKTGVRHLEWNRVR